MSKPKNRRPQSGKGHEPTPSFRIREEQRRGSRTDRHRDHSKFNRNDFRNQQQRGNYDG